MRKTTDGEYVVSREELALLRAALFVTVYHLDPEFDDDLQSVSGYFREEFDQMMKTLDLVGERPSRD